MRSLINGSVGISEGDVYRWRHRRTSANGISEGAAGVTWWRIRRGDVGDGEPGNRNINISGQRKSSATAAGIKRNQTWRHQRHQHRANDISKSNIYQASIARAWRAGNQARISIINSGVKKTWAASSKYQQHRRRAWHQAGGWNDEKKSVGRKSI